MRDVFSRAIVKAAQHDPRVLLLTGDHGYALFDEFRRVVPRQYLNAGVAEQNMVGMAAGLAKAGFKPILYGLSAFIPIRVLEQIKLDFCYAGLSALLVGDGAGVVYSTLGSSHQCMEDLAALRALPNLDILSPADESEMALAMARGLSFQGLVYLRMGKADLGAVHAVAPPNGLTGLLPVRGASSEGFDLGLIATGAAVSVALTLSDLLGGQVPVWSVPSIRPFDEASLRSLAVRAGTLAVLEEHASTGGLGSLVAEVVAGMSGDRARVLRLGSEHGFSVLCGTYAFTLKQHGLDAASLRSRLQAQGLGFEA
jgi:transketolase